MSDIVLLEYSEKAIVLKGERTKDEPVKNGIKKLGGKYNGNLKCGPGWIFPKTKMEKVQEFLTSLPPVSEQKNNEQTENNNEDVEIFEVIKNAIKTMDDKQRLLFCSKVLKLCYKTDFNPEIVVEDDYDENNFRHSRLLN